jgi:hypothetical protein
VCDGLDASGSQNLDLSLAIPSGFASVDVLAPERQELDAAVVNVTATQLSRPSDAVRVDDVKFAARRLLSVSARQLSPTALSVWLSLLPYGGPNALTQVQLYAALFGASSSALVTVNNVGSPTLSGVCGNAVCEAGERPDAPNGIVGCPVDCPFPVSVCPSANGQTCNGVGLCVAGTCVCSSAQGYGGSACEQCAPGFAPNGSGACVKYEAAKKPPSSSGGSGWKNEYIAIIVCGGAFLIAMAVVTAVVIRRKRGAGPGKYGPKTVPVDEVVQVGATQQPAASGNTAGPATTLLPSEVDTIVSLGGSQPEGSPPPSVHSRHSRRIAPSDGRAPRPEFV